MGVVGGDRHHLCVVQKHPVQQVAAVGSVRQHGAGVIVDLDRMGGLEQARVLERQAIPLWMGDGDEGARRRCPAGQVGPGLAFGRRREIGGQADREDMPELTVRQRRRVQFGAQDRREAFAPQPGGVGDRVAPW
jgi:hypothetical protein